VFCVEVKNLRIDFNRVTIGIDFHVIAVLILMDNAMMFVFLRIGPLYVLTFLKGVCRFVVRVMMTMRVRSSHRTRSKACACFLKTSSNF
jgi:hypothetical protein